MAGIALVHIVQDLDTGMFLCPHEGDVGFTKLLANAGRFDDVESAIDTARFNLGPSFSLVSFYEAKN